MAIEFHPVARPRKRGGQDSLMLVKTMQAMQVVVRQDYELAILQARRDGWTLRELARHLNMGYSSVKRLSEAAEARGQ